MAKSDEPEAGRRAVLAGLTATLFALAMPAAGQPQTFELVLPIAAGGAMDTAGRAIARELEKKWQASVVPINKPGAGMVVAVRYLLERPTDAHTMMIGGLGYSTSQFRPSGPPFNPDDLTPVAYLGWQGTVLYIRPTIPANTVAEFVQWAKNNPKGVTFASSGVGSSPHIGAEEFAALTGIQITHVPYTGSAAFQPAIQGGHVDAVFDSPSRRSLVESGKLKALMYGGKDPVPGWPELPTAPAAGLPNFKSGTWYGFLAKAQTHPAAVRKLNADINEVLRMPAIRAQLDTLGITPGGGPPEDFAQLLKSEHDRLGHVIKTRNVTIN